MDVSLYDKSRIGGMGGFFVLPWIWLFALRAGFTG